MIRSFFDKATAAVFEGKRPKGFPAQILERRGGSWPCSTRSNRWTIFASRLATALRRFNAADRVSTRSGSTISGGYASSGRTKALGESRWSIITMTEASARRDALGARTAEGGRGMYGIENGQDKALDIVEELPPLHPGEVLLEEFIHPHGLSAGKVAKACRVPRTRIERIVQGAKPITPDTAVRLAAYFRTSVRFWLNLQARYDAEVAERELADVARTIEPLARAA
jgi:antitoxin HigA-1